MNGLKPNETVDNKGAILWDRPMLERFKIRHKEMEILGHKEFTFDGHEFVTAYAKYLIEYLEGILK